MTELGSTGRAGRTAVQTGGATPDGDSRALIASSRPHSRMDENDDGGPTITMSATRPTQERAAADRLAAPAASGKAA